MVTTTLESMSCSYGFGEVSVTNNVGVKSVQKTRMVTEFSYLLQSK